MSIHVRRSAAILRPDPSRVLLRPFNPGNPDRMARIMARIMALPEGEISPLLEEVEAEFSGRHQQIRNLFIPYGLADSATAFATVPLAEVLAAMSLPA